MNDPAVFVLLLEQGDRSLEDHTEDFVFLSNYTHYPDNCLCSFYQAGLNTSTRAQLSGDGPRESLAAFIEWVLVSCKSKLTVDIAGDDTSPTLDPEPSQLPPHGAELPEPTADGEPEPSPSGATELTIAPEPEPQVSDQVREPTAQATVDTAVEIAGALESPAHGDTAERELTLDSGVLIDLDTEILFTQPSSVLSDWQNIPPNLPLPPPLIDLFPFSTQSSLDFVSLSAHPQLTICGVGSPLVCRSPAPLALSLENPRFCLGPATQRLHHGFQLPRLHRSPSIHQLHRAPSSLWLHLGQSSPYLHLETTLLWLRLVPSSLWLRWAPPSLQLHLSPLSLRLRRGLPELRLHLGR